MGLFQKKILPIVTPQYQLGHQETVLIVGLGNIGEEYQLTRHNAGFLALDYLATQEEFNPWVQKNDLKAVLCAKVIAGKKVILCKPTTMMNLSGEAVQAVQCFYRISASKTLVIYDELDLAFGTLRAGSGGQSAGHNGIKSLLSHTENSFWRIRIGIGPKQPKEMDTADFVLQRFSSDEQQKLSAVQKEASGLTQEWLAGSATAETRTV